MRNYRNKFLVKSTVTAISNRDL